ncbi:MAG: hypothetical protein RMI74_01775, partial [Thermodesulfobacterium sp.]|nr:hypothetical protein [Thermodesulfobacterium sp.]
RMEFELKTYSERKYEQGLLREAQEMVLEVVEVKLGRVPEVLKREIEREQDRGKLKRLHRELIISLDPEKTLLNFGYSLD